MGGMSSLSFDNLFPPDGSGHSDAVARPLPGGNIAKLNAAWSNPLQVVLPAEARAADASAWALSAGRRTLDCLVAILALIGFMPLMFCLGLLVRLDSPGPIFFRQRRMGRHGREFTLFKFRSMSPKSGSNCCITVSGDNRVTRVGTFLRRYKLDELPQFWNVLRGDMGLVGPRPKLPHHEALHMCCRPGITGVATLAFRNEEEFLSEIPREQLEAFYELFVKPAKAHLDLQYMQTATFSSDVKVLWRTLTSCLFSNSESMGSTAETIAQFEESRKAPAWRTRYSSVSGQASCTAEFMTER
jgi:lipopolysaccharide/colanic/teichoic acid biosynthesis glycosyltransferase